MKRHSYAIEQRLRMVDFLLRHYGHVRRSALEDFFGISTPQASEDFHNYLKLAPTNMIYNSKLKHYERGPEFVRVYP